MSRETQPSRSSSERYDVGTSIFGHLTTADELFEWAREPCRGPGNGDHNCIRISKWFRVRWVCVRCQRIFKVDTR